MSLHHKFVLKSRSFKFFTVNSFDIQVSDFLCVHFYENVFPQLFEKFDRIIIKARRVLKFSNWKPTNHLLARNFHKSFFILNTQIFDKSSKCQRSARSDNGFKLIDLDSNCFGRYFDDLAIV